MTKSCFVYDITISSQSVPSQAVLLNWVKVYSKKYCFQEEEGKENGYQHYQCRISTHGRTTKADMTKLLIRFFPDVLNFGYKVSTTSKNASTGKMFYEYCAKDDTRVAGPWTDKNEKYVPKQIRDKTPYGWQKAILDSAGFEERIVNVIVDPTGNHGKTILATFARSNGFVTLPPVGDAKELIATTCDILTSKKLRDPKLILIDIPRTVNPNRLHSLFTAIETVKSGWVYDMRYSFREWIFDCPSLWVLTNNAIDTSMMSRDTWRYHYFNEEGDLVSKVSNI